MNKKQFLDEHNKLAPVNLQATFAMLTRFEQEKGPSIKNDDWSMNKLRPSFIIWLLTLAHKEDIIKDDQSGYRNYPETKF